MNKQDILNLLNRIIADQKQFKEYFAGEYSLEMLKNGEREKLLDQVKELQSSFEVLDQNYKNKGAELETKLKRTEEEYQAKLNTLGAQIQELDLRKANLVADIEVLKMNKLRILDQVSELKAERSMKKTANV